MNEKWEGTGIRAKNSFPSLASYCSWVLCLLQAGRAVRDKEFLCLKLEMTLESGDSWIYLTISQFGLSQTI